MSTKLVIKVIDAPQEFDKDGNQLPRDTGKINLSFLLLKKEPLEDVEKLTQIFENFFKTEAAFDTGETTTVQIEDKNYSSLEEMQNDENCPLTDIALKQLEHYVNSKRVELLFQNDALQDEALNKFVMNTWE